MRHLVQSLSAACLVAALAGCGGGPSDRQVENALRRSLQEDVDWLEVRNFKKTNGHCASATQSTAWVEYDLVFTKSASEIKAATRSGTVFAAAPDPEAMKNELKAMGILIWVQTMGELEAGHTVHREDTIELVQSEKGWLVKPAQK